MYDTDPKERRQERRQRIKEGIEVNQSKSAKEARLNSRMAYQSAKKEYRLAQKTYVLHQKPKPTAKALFFKQEADKAKLNQQVAKEVYRRAKKADSTYLPNQLKYRSKQGIYARTRRDVEQSVRDNDILGDWVKARQNIRQLRFQKEGTKRALESSKNLSKYTIKHGYGQVNRAYNFIRGRGYTRTPKDFSWEGKLSTQLSQTRQKVAQSKAGKAVKGTGQVLDITTKPIRMILANPLSLKSYGLMFLILAILALFMGIFGGSSPIQQDEFSLNQSWLHLSNRDRKESTDKVDYYTDIDSILLYMNYRYGGEWEPDAKWEEGRGGKLSGVLGFNHFSDALDDIWKEENKDPNNLKTMAELYTNGKEWMRFSSDELEEYKEILDSQSETGKYLAYQELANPFYSVDDEKAETEHLSVTQRYGYTDKDTIDPTTTLQAASDKLYAPMDGNVTVTKTDLKGKKTKTTNVIIADKEARFIFYDVKNIRVKTDDTVETGVELGKVSGDTQQIAYAKNYGEVEDKDAKWLKEIATRNVSYGFTEKTKQDKTNTWVLVNPGFYFPFVTYAQQTTVIQEASEMSGRAKQFYDLVKKKVKNATDNGIAAIAGCFGVESGIQPKRAEGDFLSPPVGASPSSWDDDKWLDIPGPAIYGGGYPNILRRGLGMGQFTDTTDGAIRNTLLREYAKKKGKKWYDMELQVDFMLEGDNPYYTKIFKEIVTSNRDVDTLTAEFLAKWEGVPGNKLAQRQAIAHQALSWFKMDFLGGATSIAKGDIAHIFSVPYTVVQPYGKTPWSQGGGAWMYPMGRHSGIDLQGQGFQSGDVSLHSATDGKVNTVANDPMGGYYVIIEPSKIGGYIYYGHMKSTSIQKGQSVKKGQKIGVMGTGGGVYHVHFEYNTSIPTIGTALSQDKDPGFLIPAKGLTQNQVINPK